jgi:hypothetical protein
MRAVSDLPPGTNDPSPAGVGSSPRDSLPVVKIVFVGQADACECTLQRIHNGWGALKRALGTPPAVPVVRLQIDADAAKVDSYIRQRPILVIPAVYFLDENGVIVELLQGEITESQITPLIER